MDYTQLDSEHKRAFLVNLRVLNIATSSLEKITGLSQKEWGEGLLQDAVEDIDQLTDTEIDRYIAEIESQHNQHKNVGGVIGLKRFN
jgi:hypothetical protein